MADAKTRIGIYAGSFDPITLGHLDVLERARRLFDKVIVAIGHNSHKATLFTLDERLAMLRESSRKWRDVEIASFKGLTVDYAKSVKASALIRGVRTADDLHAEMAMAEMNRLLAEKIETIFIPTNPIYFHISSSLVKDVALNGGDLSSLVSATVSQRLAEKFNATI